MMRFTVGDVRVDIIVDDDDFELPLSQFFPGSEPGQLAGHRGLLEPDLSVSLLLRSVAIAVAVGVISGLYPAWRSSRLTPSRALHV